MAEGEEDDSNSFRLRFDPEEAVEVEASKAIETVGVEPTRFSNSSNILPLELVEVEPIHTSYSLHSFKHPESNSLPLRLYSTLKVFGT